MPPTTAHSSCASSPLLRAARRLATARPEAQRFAARAWLGAPLVRVSLALIGLRSTLRWIEAVVAMGDPERVPQPPPARPVGVVEVDEGRALVRGAFRFHVVGGECLHQSLVQYLVHHRDGLATRFVVGVKRSGHDGGDPQTPGDRSGIAAHAWVEDGDAEAPSRSVDPTFVPLFVSAAEPRDTRGITGGGSSGPAGVPPTGDAIVAVVPGTWSTT